MPSKNFPCKHCGAEQPLPSGSDPCIGLLPGVENACCGHGGEGYVQFSNGLVLRGKFEESVNSLFFKKHGRLPRRKSDYEEVKKLKEKVDKSRYGD